MLTVNFCSVFKLLVLDFLSKSEGCVFPRCMANVGQESPDLEFGLMPGLGVREARLIK